MSFRRTATATLAAVLLLAACGDDTDGSEPSTPPTEPEATDTPVEEPDEATDDAVEEPAESAEMRAFDPSETVPLRAFEASAMGSSEVDTPFADLPAAFAFDIPAAYTPVTWAPPEEGWVTRFRQVGRIQLAIPGGDVDSLTAFVEAQAAQHGWEPTDDGSYTAVLPLEAGPEGLPNNELDGWVADADLRISFNDAQDPIWMNIEVSMDVRFTG